MKCSLIVIFINLYAEKHRSEMKMMEGSAADLREQIKNEFQGLLKKVYNHFCSCGSINVHGFQGSTLSTNLYSHELVTINTFYISNDTK